MSYLQTLRNSPAAAESESPNTEVFASQAQISAMRLINLAGCRIIRTGDADQIGIWEDMDGPELRAAFRAVNMQDFPVIYLGPDVPMRYRVRVSVERKSGESFAQWRTRALGGPR